MTANARSLDEAVEALKRDPSQPVRAQVDDLTVEIRAVEPEVTARPNSQPSPEPAKPVENQRRPLHRPHPDDEADVSAGLEDVKAGRILSPEQTAAHLRWLETGEGDPWGDPTEPGE